MRSDKETYSQPLTTVLQQGVSLFLTPMNKPQGVLLFLHSHGQAAQ